VSSPTGNAKQAYVLIIHEVEDYEKWKVVFDDAAQIRREAGEIAYQLLTFDDEGQQIVHMSRWTSLKTAKAFFESPKLIEIRRIAGVRAPQFHYLNLIEAKTLS